MLKPHLDARPELEHEIHISETPRGLWRVQNLVPPPQDSEAEKRWRREDKASAWEWVGEGENRAAL
jgi:hypothetical protein